MNRIRLLPEVVANQIAAGEVVDRPVSIVKELVENAIDAQSTRITIEIQGGGRALIRVTDDGIGMSRDDALMCLERHATSKIRTSEDLFRIDTMGFRGEAVPSIASVSRFVLTTRERESAGVGEAGAEASQVVVHGGKIAEVRSAGHAPGTTVEVRQLFFNVPARRKFLKSDDTERAHIHHFLHLAALAHPAVGFTFIQDGRQIWQLPPLAVDESRPSQLKALKERLGVLFGRDLPLIPVDFADELGSGREFDALREEGDADPCVHLRIWGFIGAPGVSRSTREDQNLFVNRRPVEHRGLNFAMVEGYHTSLMKGRFPVCCLFIEIAPSEVDVNVHPAKKEVKFRHEHGVRRLLGQAVQQALRQFHTGSVGQAGPTSYTPPPRALPPQPSAPDNTLPLPLPPATSLPRPSIATDPARSAPPATATSKIPAPAPAHPAHASAPALAGAPTTAAAPLSIETPANTPRPLLAVPLRIVGVVGNLYVVLESDRGMVLLDQHAAHERVLFEQMLQRMETGSAPSQKLLLPETVELSPRDAQFLRLNLDALCRLGMGLSEFGERTFLLDGLPPFVKSSEPRKFVLEVIDQLKSAGQDVNTLRLGEPVIAKTVCRHAVKANDPLRGPELDRLLQDLRACTMPYTCPHGRPTLIEFNYKELEKRFGRIQG